MTNAAFKIEDYVEEDKEKNQHVIFRKLFIFLYLTVASLV